MNKVTAGTLIDFYKRSNEMGPFRAAADPEMNKRNEDILQYLEDKTKEASNLVQEHIKEKDVVILLKMLEGLTTAAMVGLGGGGALFMASQTGELQTYTQNVCLAFLGIVVDEEII